MQKAKFKGKKLLILGGNVETVPLIAMANEMGLKTIVASSVPNEPGKKVAWKGSDVDGMDVPGLVKLAVDEKVDGVIVGVADMLVPSYCKVCDALNLPCYATKKIVDVFAFKDVFKSTCERYGIHGIPEYFLDSEMKHEDLEKIQYPVMVKPVDSASGQGITKCDNESDIRKAVPKALSFSKQKRFIVEQYMNCDDMGIYYTFKDGACSASCVYDRYASTEQSGVSRVCLGGTYPSKHINDYFKRMHPNALRLFKAIGIENGVLMLSAFFEKGEFYVYDTGFRLQGEAPHLLIKAIHGFDQREMLLNFAMTGSEDTVDLCKVDDAYFGGKQAATLWFLLKSGIIGKIEGLDELSNDSSVVSFIQRFQTGDTVKQEWIGTEKQVFGRMYFVCNNKTELAERLYHYMNSVKVFDSEEKNMLLSPFNVKKALELEK